MKYVNLGNTKEKVSEVCLGAMMLGTAMDKKSSFRILDHFYEELGGNFIDTANCYAWWLGSGEYIGIESENILGQWLKERKNRDKLFIATKVGARLKDPHHIRNVNGKVEWTRVKSEYEGLSRNVIMREVENSLLRLKTDYIDLYYTHVYDSKIPIAETMDALNVLIKEGKVRYLGASNLSANQLRDANHICENLNYTNYSVVQSEYSYIHPKQGANADTDIHVGQDMFDYISTKGMAFCAYSPLLKGIYSNKDKRYQYYNWHLFDSEESCKKLDLVEELSSKLNITGNQLVLAWLLRRTPNMIPILGFSKMEQYLENIAACNIDIPDEVIHLMDA